MTHHSDFDAWQEPPPKEHWITEADADSRSLRSFWRGSVFGATIIGALILASAAWGQSTMVEGQTGRVTLFEFVGS